MEWDEFLTPEEKEQMDNLMKRAEERRKKKTENDESRHFLLMECQCMCMRQMQEKEGNMAMLPECFESMKQFLKMVCGFCREHRFCEYRKDEELPFP